MKKIKIITAVLSAVILTLCSCGCSQSGETPPQGGNATEITGSEAANTTKEEHNAATPSPTSEPAETTVPETSSTEKSDTETASAKPAETTPKPVETAPKPTETTAKPTETDAPKPAETTAATTAAPETTAEATAKPTETVQPLNGSLLHSYTQKWFYNQINDKQKTAYGRLYNALSNGQSQIDVSDLDMDLDDLRAACFSYEKDNPEFISTYWEYSAEYYGTEDNADVQTIVALTDSSADSGRLKTAADSVIAEAKKLPNDYQRLKYVHDWISENTVYNDNGKHSSKRADGPILYGEAICSGYSKALMYFAQELGIPCICIEGYTNEEHLWNMVKLDGSWYHVDMTYDDPKTPSGANALRYDYFLVSDSTIRKDHTINQQIALPQAPNDYIS